MGTIKGQNLRVLVNANGTPKCIAMATSMQLHVATQMEDSSTKDSTGDWQEQEPVGLSWDASCDALVTPVDNGNNGTLYKDLLDLQLGKQKVTLVFDQTAGTNNRVAQNTAALKRTGEAYISDVSLTAPNRANSTLAVQFQGTGPLATA